MERIQLLPASLRLLQRHGWKGSIDDEISGVVVEVPRVRSEAVVPLRSTASVVPLPCSPEAVVPRLALEHNGFHDAVVLDEVSRGGDAAVVPLWQQWPRNARDPALVIATALGVAAIGLSFSAALAALVYPLLAIATFVAIVVAATHSATENKRSFTAFAVALLVLFAMYSASVPGVVSGFAATTSYQLQEVRKLVPEFFPPAQESMRRVDEESSYVLATTSTGAPCFKLASSEDYTHCVLNHFQRLNTPSGRDAIDGCMCTSTLRDLQHCVMLSDEWGDAWLPNNMAGTTLSTPQSC